MEIFSWKAVKLDSEQKFSEQADVGNGETDLRIKSLLSLQNILSNKQIAADIEGKWANQGKVLCGGISRIYLSLANRWKPCHGTINSRPCNLSMALEKYFRFRWNCKQLRIEVRNSMANCEINFSIFYETIHTTLKIFSQHELRKVFVYVASTPLMRPIFCKM